MALHPAAMNDEALLRECRFSRGRRSGPGGQHRNKVETWVELLHVPTGVSGQAGERRSQHENKSVALFRLRLELALRVRSQVAPAGPSDLWRSRCRGGRVAVSPQHTDFPALLAEALDALAAAQWEPREAAEHLGCTPSQLLKLLAAHPPAFAACNAERASRGLHVLK